MIVFYPLLTNWQEPAKWHAAYSHGILMPNDYRCIFFKIHRMCARVWIIYSCQLLIDIRLLARSRSLFSLFLWSMITSPIKLANAFFFFILMVSRELNFLFWDRMWFIGRMYGFSAQFVFLPDIGYNFRISENWLIQILFWVIKEQFFSYDKKSSWKAQFVYILTKAKIWEHLWIDCLARMK